MVSNFEVGPVNQQYSLELMVFVIRDPERQLSRNFPSTRFCVWLLDLNVSCLGVRVKTLLSLGSW